MSYSGKRLSRNFTQGNIPRQLLFFALPFMASNALQVLYNTVDMAVVGAYVGTPGLSAVSQSGQIVNFASMMMLGLSNGGQVLVAQALGAEKRKEVNQIIGTLFSLIMIFSAILTCGVLFFRHSILDAINIPTESASFSMDYLTICGAGLVFTAGYNMVSAVLRGMGDSKRPFMFIGIASAVNLVLDLLFVGVFRWEVAGAAWATIIGQAVSFAFSVFYLMRNREAFGFDFQRKSFAINKRYAGMILSLGAPMAIQSGSINLSMLFVNSMVNDVGVVASATFGVGVRIDDIINKISQGIQHAALPMIGQNIAAGQIRRSQKVVHFAWLYAGVLTVVFMALYGLFGTQMFMLFSDDPAVHQLSGTFIKAILWMFPAFIVVRGVLAFIQGIGNTKLSMMLAILDGVVLRIGLSWLFGIALDWGFYGFVLGYGLAAYGVAVPGLVYFLSGLWKRRKVLAEDI